MKELCRIFSLTMEALMGKTATKMWRQSGTALPFKQWIEQEKEKMSADGQTADGLLLVNRSLNDSVQNAINEAVKTGGLKKDIENKTIFGISKPVFIVSAVLFTGGLIYLITRIVKK
jgi:hypothetical protein